MLLSPKTFILSLLVIIQIVSADFTLRPKPTFRVLFNNDLTNVRNCQSAYHKFGEPFSKEILQASINETCNTGIDVHLLSPGHSWAPLWKSKIYPYEKHAKWYKQRTGLNVTTFGQYMLEGGDIVGDFVEHCKKVNMPAFISFRLNDWHQKNYVDLSKEQLKEYNIQAFSSMETCKFYDEHPEYRLNSIFALPPMDDIPLNEYLETYRNKIKSNNIHDWSIPEVRNYKFDFIQEICNNYDIDGLELDFMRHKWYFKPSLPFEERKKIMSNFVMKIRALLDKTARNGKYRWLCARIPTRLKDMKSMGLDPQTLYQTGVDMFNLSYSYETEQQNDLAKIHKLIPQAALYLEITHVIARYEPDGKSAKNHKSLSLQHVMTKPEQYFTSAHLAYGRGARGVSLFNFAYYREYAERQGTVCEPFFEIFKTVSTPSLLANQPQHYFIADFDHDSKKFTDIKIQNGLNETFTLDMALPNGGLKHDAKLRIQVEPSWENIPCTITFNNVVLKNTDKIEEPYETILKDGLGNKNSLAAWIVPKETIVNGINYINIIIPKGCDSKLILLDIAVQ